MPLEMGRRQSEGWGYIRRIGRDRDGEWRDKRKGRRKTRD